MAGTNVSAVVFMHKIKEMSIIPQVFYICDEYKYTSVTLSWMSRGIAVGILTGYRLDD
jgi:hypothetical protein